MLKISHISKTFNPGTVNEKKALEDFSLELKKGDFATIIGSNGAGKSTFFNAVCGDFLTDSGSVILDGEDITFTPQHVRAKSIGRLYQDPMRGTAPGMRKSCTCSRQRWMAFPYDKTGKRTFSGRIKETGYWTGRTYEPSGRSSFRWSETGTDTSYGDNEPAQTAPSG